MVRLILFALTCACLSVARPDHAASNSARADSSFRGYTRLGDWARANNFQLHWLDAAGTALQLSNHSSRFVFYRDSREAELGGVRVCLSFPVFFISSTAYISDLDLETAIRPLLYPPKNAQGSKIRSIVLDPGHGGKDPGNIVGFHQEKKYALLLAQEVADQLRRAGFAVTLTRTADNFVELPDRPVIARRRGADLFISLHWNELPGNSEMKGAQIFCLTPAGASSSNAGRSAIGVRASPGNRNNSQNLFLAYALQKSLLSNVGVEDRGVRRARYWVLRDATMPAVLIEGGFMSNPGEAKKIYDPAYRQQMARAIVAGVLEYKRQVE